MDYLTSLATLFLSACFLTGKVSIFIARQQTDARY